MVCLAQGAEGSGEHVTPAKVMIVEDEGLYRDLLSVALSQDSHLRVVGAFADGESALRSAPDLKPDVLLVDIELGRGMNGIQMGLLLRRALPELGVVILSNHRDFTYLSSVPREAISGWSYLLKKSVSDVDALQRAIHGAVAGLVVLDPQMVSDWQLRQDGRLSRLTPRHRQVLSLISQGFTNAAIAERLMVSQKSVENQINSLYQALEIDRSDRSLQPRVKAVLTYLEASRPGPGDETPLDSIG